MKEINAEKFTQLTKQVYDIATEHGWHDKPLSAEHYLGLVMTEVAEAVEADRMNKRAKTDMLAEVMRLQSEEGEGGLCWQWYESWFQIYYREYIKGSIEEEFADIVIRIFDMAQGIHGSKMSWKGYYPYGDRFMVDKSFVENAWHFTKETLNWGTMNITDSVFYIFDWAESLGIDLLTHIEWKMKYNELREYKHGGKKY